MNQQKQGIYRQKYPEDDWKFKWMGFADIYDRIKKKKDFSNKKEILKFIKTFNGKTLFDLANYLNLIIGYEAAYSYGKKRARYEYVGEV